MSGWAAYDVVVEQSVVVGRCLCGLLWGKQETID